MKWTLLTTSALFAVLSTTAFAADLPTAKGPPIYAPPPPPAWTWTGFYAGVVGGGGWGRARNTDATGFDSGGYNLGGGIVGGTIGYNMQMSNFVVGIEGDGSGAWIRGTTSGTVNTCGGATARCSMDLDALGTVRGRLGVTFDRFMPYITGGAAIGDLRGSEGDGIAGAFGSGSSTVVGWTIGAGVEAKIAPQWTAKIEYLHVDLGNHAIFSDTVPGTGVVAQDVRFTSEIVRAGINYQFDLFALPAPVAAKY